MKLYFNHLILIIPALLFLLLAQQGQAANDDIGRFNDAPLVTPLELPSWFKLSFLDLQEDVADAVAANKRGIILYFGQKECPYCKAHLEENWGRSDIVAYTQKYFDVVAIDVKGNRSVTDIDGQSYDEKSFAYHNKTHFTPSLIFLDNQGRQVFKLYGLYPPYKFRAALEFVADKHYEQEDFRQYLARGEILKQSGSEQLHQHGSFSQPPYQLGDGKKAILVIFEQTSCHACDVFHDGPLQNPEINKALAQLRVIQLDMWSQKQQITLPDGRQVTARQWADEMGLFYTPSLIFFNPEGEEIIRVDSIVWFNRLNNVLHYVISEAYRYSPNFQQWRQQRVKEN